MKTPQSFVGSQRRKYDHSVYKKITHKERLDIIYNRKIHNMSLGELQNKFQIKYNSVRNILNAYESSGRTCKKKFYKQSRSKTPTKETKTKQTLEISMLKNFNYANYEQCRAIDQEFGQVNHFYNQYGKNYQHQKTCSLKLYVCQGPSVYGGVNSLPSGEDPIALVHKKPEDYEKLFVFNQGNCHYPYQFGQRDLSSNDSEAEAFHSDISQYENGKDLQKVFTGSFEQLNELMKMTPKEKCNNMFLKNLPKPNYSQ